MAAVAKDPAIKLFGRTISLPETQFSDDFESLDNGSSFIARTETEELRNGTSLILDEVVSYEQPQTFMKQPITSQAATNPKDHPQDQSDSSGEPKQMKRLDKILPCPRCNSSDTKFCYFNNYNVNQPRHFCKSCQRYWTAGGTVRNVPVGAGRRRNKHLASQYRQVMASTDVGLTMVSETLDSTNQLLTCEESSSSCTGSSPNHEMVLKFGPESPYCDNSGASLTASSFGVRTIKRNDVSSQHQMYHYVVPPQMTTSNVPNSNGSVSMAVPGFATPNMTYQLVPAAYMNCIPLWVAGSGNVSLAVSNGSQLQVLGKHSRDVNGAPEGSIEEGISAPKAVRIHELHEP